MDRLTSFAKGRVIFSQAFVRKLPRGAGSYRCLHMGDVLARRHSSIRNTCFRAPRGIDIAGGIRPGLGTWVPQTVFL